MLCVLYLCEIQGAGFDGRILGASVVRQKKILGENSP